MFRVVGLDAISEPKSGKQFAPFRWNCLGSIVGRPSDLSMSDWSRLIIGKEFLGFDKTARTVRPCSEVLGLVGPKLPSSLILQA